MHLHDRAAISSVLPENILFIEWNSQIEYFTYRLVNPQSLFEFNVIEKRYNHYSDDLKIHSWDGSAKDSSSKTITLNKGTHILDIDCMNISQQSMDQRKRSSEMFAIGTSDGKRIKWFHLQTILSNVCTIREMLHHAQVGPNREDYWCSQRSRHECQMESRRYQLADIRRRWPTQDMVQEWNAEEYPHTSRFANLFGRLVTILNWRPLFFWQSDDHPVVCNSQ